eukprot:gnl/TRDRNA2_/TRDRNA2_128628_c0_seq1.p1 gnl/TRDRNA2_/TRDRNA2_128628_c0~~gnl/TRDRNA2_/TRDRNA2_128628_c0_seq1.p1  ORF type:complete len:202 (+),score=35.87 gnl/TRDRNA2_/TRDRNA2_128628_c0_seq1:38-643(+)
MKHSEDDNPKAQLSKFYSRQCNRPVVKGDIIYTVNKVAGGYQSIVTLTSFLAQDGKGKKLPTAFTSDLAENEKQAEKAAASKALEAYADLIKSAMSAGPGNAKERRQAKRKALQCVPASADAEKKPKQAPSSEADTSTTVSSIAVTIKTAAGNDGIVHCRGYKTQMCKIWRDRGGKCPKGDSCNYAHGAQEIRDGRASSRS